MAATVVFSENGYAGLGGHSWDAHENSGIREDEHIELDAALLVTLLNGWMAFYPNHERLPR